MARIPEEIIQEVLIRADIGSVVSRYVALKKAGANMKGLCPFHSEKTPSFNVHPTKGIYKCFGCGAGGNAIGFLMAIEGWNFPEAVRKLAGEVNVVIPEATPEEEEKRQAREKGRDAYFRVMSIARDYFVDQLWNNPKAEGARFYLKERGIDDETVKTFELGYAPDEWDALIEHFQTHRIPPTWLERAGLVSRRSRGDGFFDKFRHRIMFPVVDVWNNTVAFSGRVLRADDNPKYMNSPETTYYTKGDHLYGLHVAKSAVQKSAYTIVVEGNFDVVSLYAAGVQNVVAPLGTAFTNKQARLIKRYCATAVFAFDGDSAGRKATLRCLPSTEAHDLEARVVPFDDGDDPDTCVRREGKEAFEILVADALPLVEWAFVEHFPRGERGDVNDNVRAIEFAVELLKEVKNGVVRTRHIQDISRRLAIEPRLLSEYIKRPEKSGAAIRETVSTIREVSIGKTEKAILAVLLDNPDWFSEFLNEEYDSIMHSRELAQFFHDASVYFAKANTIIGVEMVAHQSIRKTVVDTKGQEMSEWFPEGGASKYFLECIDKLKREWADRRGAELAEAIERSNSPEDQRTLVRELQEVVRFKHSIGTSK